MGIYTHVLQVRFMALQQLHDYPCANEVTLIGMGKFTDKNTTKRNKTNRRVMSCSCYSGFGYLAGW